MRTIRALAATAVFASLLAASGPAAAKIMQLTLGTNPTGLVRDVTDYMGGGGGYTGNDAYMFNFIFTYDTNVAPVPGSAALLSARIEIRGDVDNPRKVYDPNGGEFLGSFDIPVGPNNNIVGNETYIRPYFRDYHPLSYQISANFGTRTEVDAFNFIFPDNGTGALDEDMTYYPEQTGGRGNSIYDLLFFKQGENSVLIYGIYTDTTDNGALTTRYVNFKDITQQGVPEPAAWALMLLGFGGLGAALRRRRAAGLAL